MEAEGPALALTGAGIANFNMFATGGTFSGTAPNCNIGASQTSCADTAGCSGGISSCTHRLTISGAPCTTQVAFGETVGSTGLTGTLTGPMYMGSAFQSTNANEGMVFGAAFSSPGTIIGWISNFLSYSGTAELVASNIVPTPGTLDTMCIVLSAGAPPAGGSITYTVLKNGSATSVSCTVTGPNSTCNTAAGCSPSVPCPGANVPVVVGDTISIKICPSNVSGCPAGTAIGTGIVVSWSMRWLPTNPKEALIWAAPLGSGTLPAATASTNYYNVSNGGGNSSTPSQGPNANIIPYVPTNITFKDWTTAWCWGTGSDTGRTFTFEATNTPATLPSTAVMTSGLQSGVTVAACQTAGSSWTSTYMNRDTVDTFVTTTPVTDNTLFDTKAINGSGTHQAFINGGFKQAFVAVVQ
jgi:hypothetical protein